jgi:hypothetical protein
MPNKTPASENEPKDIHYVFCKEYTNRWGKRMVASEYGYDYWRLPIRNKRNH